MQLCPMCMNQLCSDGDVYHSTSELYCFSSVQFILICNLLSQGLSGCRVFKTHKNSHNSPVDPDFFYLCLELPDGRQCSMHLPIDCWEYCLFPELSYNYRYDGHNNLDVLKRLMELVITMQP